VVPDCRFSFNLRRTAVARLLLRDAVNIAAAEQNFPAWQHHQFKEVFCAAFFQKSGFLL